MCMPLYFCLIQGLYGSSGYTVPGERGSSSNHIIGTERPISPLLVKLHLHIPQGIAVLLCLLIWDSEAITDKQRQQVN